jgi:hypothetical protein
VVSVRHAWQLKRAGEAGTRRKPADQTEPDPDESAILQVIRPPNLALQDHQDQKTIYARKNSVRQNNREIGPDGPANTGAGPPPSPRAPRGGERARRVGRGQLPDGEDDDGTPRPEASAREAHDPEPESEEQADGAGDGLRPTGQGEETNVTKPRPAPEAATAETRAADREARRPARICRTTPGPPSDTGAGGEGAGHARD